MMRWESIRKYLRDLVVLCGYDIRRIPPSAAGSSYGIIRINATYSPWKNNEQFQMTYNKIKSHTLVDVYRCFELWFLVGQTLELEGSLLEVGVWRGGTGALIAQSAKLAGIGDPVYLCDTFTGVVKANLNDSSYKGNEHSDTTQETVELLLKSLALGNVKILKGVFPDESSFAIEHQRFRFCHIDVDVYESAKQVSEWVWPRLAVGGIVVYDDYGFPSCDGVTKYVEEQMSCADRVTIHNLNGHAVVVKTR